VTDPRNLNGKVQSADVPAPAQTKLADLVQITPSDFKKSSLDAIQDNINEKYANKVDTRFVVA